MIFSQFTDFLPWFETTTISEYSSILASKVCLLRNLSNFNFLNKMSDKELETVQKQLSNTFSQIDTEKAFQKRDCIDLSGSEYKYLFEYDILNRQSKINDFSTIFFDAKNSIYGTVNIDEHYKLFSIKNGLELYSSFENLRKIDCKIQEKEQVVFSNEFGYLNQDVFACGNGIQASVLLFLPSLTRKNLLKRFFELAKQRGIKLTYFFGPGELPISGKGSLYLASKISSFSGNESEYLASLTNFALQAEEAENEATKSLIKEKPTLVLDEIFKTLAVVKTCNFIDYSSGIEYASVLQMARNMQVVDGFEKRNFLPLLYSSKKKVLLNVLINNKILFESDVDDMVLKEERLRSTMFKQVYSKVECVW